MCNLPPFFSINSYWIHLIDRQLSCAQPCIALTLFPFCKNIKIIALTSATLAQTPLIIYKRMILCESMYVSECTLTKQGPLVKHIKPMEYQILQNHWCKYWIIYKEAKHLPGVLDLTLRCDSEEVRRCSDILLWTIFNAAKRQQQRRLMKELW